MRVQDLTIPAALFSAWGGALPGHPAGATYLFCVAAQGFMVACNFTG